MPDEQLKMVLENSASAAMRVTVHYLHFSLIPVETEFSLITSEIDNISYLIVGSQTKARKIISSRAHSWCFTSPTPSLG